MRRMSQSETSSDFLRNFFEISPVSIPNKVSAPSSKHSVQVQEHDMRSEKAWYWLAAGVLALGLNGAYQDGQLGWTHVIADRATAAVERVTMRGQHLLAMAEIMLGRNTDTFGNTFGRAETALERVQNKIVCDRVARAQRQIAMAHVRGQLAEAKVQQRMAMVQMKMDRVRMMGDRTRQFRDCDGFSKVVVNVPDLPKIDLSNIPDIEVPEVPEVNVVVDMSSKEPI
jgi:hypothetical protein